MRPDPGAARLGSPERAHDQPGGDPPSRQQAGASGSARCSSTRADRDRAASACCRAIPKGSTRSAAAASTSSAGIPAAPTPAPGCAASATSGARRASGPAPRSRPRGPPRSAFGARPPHLARRCGEVSGWLLPHISTADTARDLDHLRVLLGEEKLTYVGLSYGTFIGQTYANMFPDRVRAMLLNGIVDAPKDSKGAEARSASDVSSADEVFDQFLSLCDERGTGALRARRWRPDRGRARRAAVRAGEARADPGSGGEAAAVVAPEAELRRSAAVAVRAAEGSRVVAGQRGGSRRRAAGRRIGARERGKRLPLARRLGRRDDLGGDLLRRRAGPRGARGPGRR